MIDAGFEILNQRGTPMFFSDTFANRPAAGIVGRIFISTDTNEIYRDTGTGWNLIGGPGSGTITGSIVAGQVAFGTATDVIGGSNNLFWDNINFRLGIGTQVPQTNIQISNNKNGITSLQISNTTAGALSQAGLRLDSNTASGTMNVGKYSSLSTNYLSILATDGYLSNANFGDIVLQNEVSTGRIKFSAGASSTPQMTLFSTGNLGIGTGLTDGGQRLQVTGDTLLRGSGTSSDALIIQNSGSAPVLTARGDTRLTIGGKVDIGLTNISFNAYSNTFNILGIIPSATWTSEGTGIWFFDRAAASTSGTLRQIRLGGIGSGFAPTSGTATYTHLEINSTINQTGGANGITRGLYVNPTLTSAVDWRSIEWSNNTGFGLYGSGSANNYLNGALGIGTTTPSDILDIRKNQVTTNQATTTSVLLSNTNASGIAAYVFTSDGTTRQGGLQYNNTTGQRNLFSCTYTNIPYNFGTNSIIRLAITGDTGNVLIQNGGTFTDNGARLQVTGTQINTDGRTYSTGSIQSFRVVKDLIIPSGATISTGSIVTMIGAGTTTFQGSVSIPNATPFATCYLANIYNINAAATTITSSQATGLRAVSQLNVQNYFAGTNSGTMTHVASVQISGFINNNTGSITPTITNAYQLLINNIDDYSNTFTFTNRWAIYQQGSSDRNYLAGNTLIGNSTTDTGEVIQINGTIRINNQLSGTAGGSSGQHLIINCDGTTYKIALLNN